MRVINCESFIKIAQFMCPQWPFYFRCDISKHDVFFGPPFNSPHLYPYSPQYQFLRHMSLLVWNFFVILSMRTDMLRFSQISPSLITLVLSRFYLYFGLGLAQIGSWVFLAVLDWAYLALTMGSASLDLGQHLGQIWWVLHLKWGLGPKKSRAELMVPCSP